MKVAVTEKETYLHFDKHRGHRHGSVTQEAGSRVMTRREKKKTERHCLSRESEDTSTQVPEKHRKGYLVQPGWPGNLRRQTGKSWLLSVARMEKGQTDGRNMTSDNV